MAAVLRLPVFRRLALAYGLNELAQQVAAVVLMLVVYDRTRSALGAGLFLLCTQFAPALTSPALVSRLSQLDVARSLPVLYGVEAALYAILAGAVAWKLPLLPLLALALADGIVALSARALARVASVAATSPHQLLREGNAFNNVSFSVCYMVGPAIGGLLLLIGSSTLALAFDAAVFVAMAVLLALTPGLTTTGLAQEGRERRASLPEAVRYVWREGAMRRIFAIRVSTLIFFSLSAPVEVVLAERTLHAGSNGYSLLLSLWGSGTVVGSGIYSLGRRLPAWILLAGSTAALAAGFGVLAAAPTLLVALAGALLAGGGNGVDAVASRTLLQESVDPQHLVLVTALNESVWQAVPALGIVVGGALASLSGARAAFAVSAAASLMLAALSARVLRPLESGAPAAPGEAEHASAVS